MRSELLCLKQMTMPGIRVVVIVGEKICSCPLMNQNQGATAAAATAAAEAVEAKRKERPRLVQAWLIRQLRLAFFPLRSW